MNAVIYARYSSDRQREESIEGQLRECTDYAMKNNLTLLGTYVDRALSARTADRPDFQRMIADSAHYKHVLKKNSVRVISIKENISDGPEGIILESMSEGYADAILVMQEQGDTMTPVLKQQLQQCEAEIRNVMKAIRQGIITETTKECLEDLETQRDSLKASILQLQLERRKFTKEEIVDWISKYKYGNINDLDYRKEIIDTFVNSVFVYDDKLVLTYNYKDGSQTLTLQEIESALSSNLTSMCPPYMKNPNYFTIGSAFGFFIYIKDTTC